MVTFGQGEWGRGQRFWGRRWNKNVLLRIHSLLLSVFCLNSGKSWIQEDPRGKGNADYGILDVFSHVGQLVGFLERGHLDEKNGEGGKVYSPPSKLHINIQALVPQSVTT